jgi:hypothetical protein
MIAVRLVRLVTTGKADTAPQLHHELQDVTNTTICAQSIRNALKKEDLVARAKSGSLSFVLIIQYQAASRLCLQVPVLD